MRPPWILERVLESFITDRQTTNDVLGDLAEEWADRASREGRWAASRWYAWQTARSVGHFLRAPGVSPMHRRPRLLVALAALLVTGALVVLVNAWAGTVTGISNLALAIFSAGGGDGGETAALTGIAPGVRAGRALAASAVSGALVGLAVVLLSRRGAMVSVALLSVLVLPVSVGLSTFMPGTWPSWYSVALPPVLACSTLLGGLVAVALTPRRPPQDPDPLQGASQRHRRRLGPRLPAARVGEVSHAARRLLKNPRFTLTAVGLLALGIGSSTAVFSVLDAVYLDDPPHITQPDQLVRLYGVDDRSGAPVSLPYPDFAYYDENQRSFDGLMGWGHTIALAVGLSDARSATGMFVSHDYFDVLGVRPAAGRWFRPDEDGGSAPRLAAVISHGLWSSSFGSDPDAMGRTVRLNGVPFVVVGVAPEGFLGPSPLEAPPDVWVPFHSQPVLAPLEWPLLERPPNGGGWTWVQGIGRLRAGVSLETARADLGQLSTYIRENFAAWTDGGVGVSGDSRFLPSREGPLGEMLGLMIVAAVALLLIAGANVSVLQLARASEHARDVSVRIALGASRGRVALSALSESLLLAGAGTVAAVALAYMGSGLVETLLPATFSVSFDPDPTVLAFACGLGLVVAAVSGLVPAMRVARVDVNRTLKGDAGAGRTRSKARNALVVAQVALGVGFASIAALTARSFVAANAIPFGFAADGRTLISTTLSSQGYARDEGEGFIRDALERLRAVPGVRSASSMSNMPFVGAYYSEGFRHPRADPSAGSSNMGVNAVSPDFFATMGIDLIAGRGIAPGDTDGLPAIVVSRSTARSVWPDQDPLGQRLYGRLGQPLWEVVGVAEDTRVRELDRAPELYGYTSVAQDYRGDVTFVIRGEASQAALRNALYEVNPSLAISDVRSLESVLSMVLSPYRTAATLMNILGALSLLLAVVGLHGVLSYAVEQGRRAIGIRVALGASHARIVSGVVRWALGLTLLGSAIGGLAAWLGAPALASFLYQVNPRDVAGWTSALVALVIVVAAASLIPAHRAASLDPVEVLKDA